MNIVFPERTARAVVIPGQEAYNDTAQALVMIPKCALIKFGPNGAELNDLPNPCGAALEKGDPGDNGFGYGTHTELSGFITAGTLPGDLVYPSAAVPGGFATGAEKLAGAPPCGRITPDGTRIKIFCI